MGKVKRKATKLLKVFVGLVVSFGIMFSVTACGINETAGTKDLSADTGIYLEEENGTEETEDNSEEISEEEGGAGESEDDVQGIGDDDSNTETDESEQDNDDSDVTEDDETNSDDDTSIETDESEEDKETETGDATDDDDNDETGDTSDADGVRDSDTERDDDSENRDDAQGTEENGENETAGGTEESNPEQESGTEESEQSQEESGTEDTVEETYLEYEEVEGGYKVIGITQDLVYVEIPSTYNGKPVVSIGTGAFKDCISMVNLIIGENVEEIESGLVEGCYKLIEIYNLSKISNDDIDKITNYEVTNIYSAEENSILEEKNGFIYFISYGEYYIVTYTGTDEKIEIEFAGETVYIYQYAFYGNSTITEVTLGESVWAVMDYAFSYCENLEKVTCLGETEIEGTAFVGTNIAS